MFCPRCGQDGTTEQHFCRSCGFELGGVSALLQEAGPESLESHDNRRFNQQKLKAVGSIVVLSTIGLALIALLVGIVVLMVVGNMPLLAGGLLLTFTTGLIIGFVCLGLASLKTSEPEKQKHLKENPATSALIQPGVEQPLLSVTEHTTELLENPKEKAAMIYSSAETLEKNK
jgi:hypothetical protein